MGLPGRVLSKSGERAGDEKSVCLKGCD